MPPKQQSAFTLDMGEDLRDMASGLTTDLEFSQPEFDSNEGFQPPNGRAPSPFGGDTNGFERAPSSYDPSSGSSYEEVVEEYEIEYDEEGDEELGEVDEGVEEDDSSSEAFWDEELNDVDAQDEEILPWSSGRDGNNFA